ncbi:nitrate/nitrite transporter NrtS [Croceicoccus bisphenolivorans]|uniref:nitrate/nitrite transporter NrtS n=1 Tax=Croceicoccus bisphenolivorans TaxID=1783232 RepID=UPI001C12BD6B|nr:nitrate/nitrite transporter NrtS [Croceicoccus bisphenolivorans]
MRKTFSGRQCVRSLVVALIVGSILNAINQGDKIAALDGIVWWRVTLTFVVPFCVASYGAYSAFRNG